MTSAAKTKGRAGEYEIAAIFGGKRNVLSGAAGGGDQVMPPPYDGLMWETKRRARLPAIATAPLAQAALAARLTPLYPVVAYREDRGRWIVAMYAEEFKAFVDAVAEVGNGHKVQRLIHQARATLDEAERSLR